MLQKILKLVVAISLFGMCAYYALVIARVTEVREFGESDVGDQRGKTIFVSGANTGLGFQTSLTLAKAGAHVIMACRNEARCAAAQERVAAEVSLIEGAVAPSVELLDLADLQSVDECADRVLSAYERLDALVLNAGVMAPERFTKSRQGFEVQFSVNHLGHFLLTMRLLDVIDEHEGRIVVVSSVASRMSTGIDFDDVAERKHSYDSIVAYADSKLANLLFARRLQRHLADERHVNTRVVVAHPGWTSTDLQRTSIVQHLNCLIAMDVREGALSQLRAVVDPSAQPLDFFGPSALFNLIGHPIRQAMTPLALDDQAAEKLWQLSTHLIESH